MNSEENIVKTADFADISAGMFTDIVFPEKNENEFFDMAEKMSITKLCFLYSAKKFTIFSNTEKEKFQKEAKAKGITLLFGILADDWKAFDKIKKEEYVFAVSKPTGTFSSTPLEEVLKKRKLDSVFGLESLERKDSLHYRRSGLNQVLCNIAKSSNVSIAFSFSEILSISGMLRSQLFGRINQNIMLCRKYKVPMLIASFASSPYQMRTHHDLANFFSVLGMTAGEAIEASEKASKLIIQNMKKSNPHYISEEIEIV